MDFYKKNMDFLQKANSKFTDIVRNGVPNTDISIKRIEGTENFIIQNENASCFINSAYNQEREMNELFSEVPDDIEILIIFGVGNGFIFDYLVSKKFTHLNKILIIEPCHEMFREVLRNKNIEKIVNQLKSIEFIIEKSPELAAELAVSTVAVSINAKMKIVSQISYRTFFNDYYATFIKMLGRHVLSIASNAITGNRNTYEIMINTINNLHFHELKIDGLMKVLKGNPVVMVSAGASLNKIMHLLNDLKEKAIVVAVGSAVKILDNNDIKPHLRAAFSPHQDDVTIMNMKHTGIPLIYMDTLYYNILPNYEGPKILMNSQNNNFAGYIYMESEIEQTYVRSELTIANTVFELLCMSECSEIILIGQDMCFTNNLQYAEGVEVNISVNENVRNIMRETNIDGEEVFTKLTYLSIRGAIEQRVVHYNNKNIKFYNCTEGGLEIKGMTHMKLQDKMNQLNDSVSVVNKLDEFIMSKNDDSSDFERIKTTMKRISNEVEQVYAVNEERVEKLKELIRLREKESDPQKVLKKYQNINEYEERLKGIEFYSKVMQHDLNSIFTTVIQAFKYDGPDLVKQLDGVENMMTKVTLEVQKYCINFKALYQEFEERCEEKHEDVFENSTEQVLV